MEITVSKKSILLTLYRHESVYLPDLMKMFDDPAVLEVEICDLEAAGLVHLERDDSVDGLTDFWAEEITCSLTDKGIQFLHTMALVMGKIDEAEPCTT